MSNRGDPADKIRNECQAFDHPEHQKSKELLYWIDTYGRIIRRGGVQICKSRVQSIDSEP